MDLFVLQELVIVRTRYASEIDDLRGRTGATVIAVVRGEESFTSPGAEFEVREQDTLILVASHRDIDRAFRYLTIGETDDPGSSNGGD